ncbi:unnamed protein product [Moneuplotes crassus]|uniref:Rab-GAP TBC domain-containing protein n=1 Tax=Euplotes crassus TaxID=5936 RepID=A0AAD2D8H8_EUPCR|nr:unnamed protein product [Moneuplotes crassus]
MKFANIVKENLAYRDSKKSSQLKTGNKFSSGCYDDLETESFGGEEGSDETCVVGLSKKMPPSRCLSFKNSERNFEERGIREGNHFYNTEKVRKNSFLDALLSHRDDVLKTIARVNRNTQISHSKTDLSEMPSTKKLSQTNVTQSSSFTQTSVEGPQLNIMMKYKELCPSKEVVDTPPNVDISSVDPMPDLRSKRISNNNVYDYQLSMSDKHKFMSENEEKYQVLHKSTNLLMQNRRKTTASRSIMSSECSRRTSCDQDQLSQSKIRRVEKNLKKYTPKPKSRRTHYRTNNGHYSVGSFYTPRVYKSQFNTSGKGSSIKKSLVNLEQCESGILRQSKYKKSNYEKAHQGHKVIQKKLNRRKSDISCQSSKALLKSKKQSKRRLKILGVKSLNQTVHKNNNLKSLKQCLKKRVMEYKTMHSISSSQKESSGDINLHHSMKPGRIVPISKAVRNCPNSKLLCKCTKFNNLESPYIYCTKSYVWLANAFSHSTPGSFSINTNKELQKLISAYHRCSNMKIEESIEEQIQKDIVRTFPNNSGCHSMYKVLSAYSNLTEMKDNSRKRRLRDTDLVLYDSDQKYSDDSSVSTKLSKVGRNRDSSIKKDVIDSFCEISFEDTTQYVQGMNFIVGILCHHLSPELAFCLFVKLIKDYDLEDNYTPGLVGFKKKSDILTNLIKVHLPDLYRFLNIKNIFLEMFTVELIMALCGSILPYDNLVRFYDYFFSYKWDYFYGFIIMFLKEIQDMLMSKEDPAEIIQILKDYTFNKTYKSTINCRDEYQENRIELQWSLILSNALDWVRDYRISR